MRGSCLQLNCKNDKNIVVNNASSSYGNNSNIISNIDCSIILVDNVPSNANDKIDKLNDNDNNGSITSSMSNTVN